MLSSTFETGPKVCKPCVSRHPHALKWKHTQHMWHCSFFTRKKKGNKLSHPSRKFAFTESFASILSPGAYKTNQLRDWQATRTTSYFKTLNHVADAGEKPLQTCQLSRIMRESPRYDTNLPVSRTGHHISRIKSSLEFFCALVWDLAHFSSKLEFFLFVVRFLGHFCTYLVTDKDYFWHQRSSRILMVCTSRETSHNVTESHNFLMWLLIITWCGFFIIIRDQ